MATVRDPNNAVMGPSRKAPWLSHHTPTKTPAKAAKKSSASASTSVSLSAPNLSNYAPGAFSGDYGKQAASEIDAMIAENRRVNNVQRGRNDQSLAKILAALSQTNTENQATLSHDAEVSRARLANLMAARGLEGGAAGFNTTRLDSQNADRLGNVLREYQRQTGDAENAYTTRAQELNDADRTMAIQRGGLISELARKIRSQAFSEWSAMEGMRAQAANINNQNALARYQAEKDAYALRYNQEQAAAQGEQEFVNNLLKMADTYSKGGSLAPLARWARAQGHDLNNYYDLLDPSAYGALQQHGTSEYVPRSYGELVGWLADNPNAGVMNTHSRPIASFASGALRGARGDSYDPVSSFEYSPISQLSSALGYGVTAAPRYLFSPRRR